MEQREKRRQHEEAGSRKQVRCLTRSCLGRWWAILSEPRCQLVRNVACVLVWRWQICSLVTRVQSIDDEKEQQRQTIADLQQKLDVALRSQGELERLNALIVEKDEKIEQVSP